MSSPTMKTLQTAEVRLPNAHYAVYTLESCPVLPKEEIGLLTDWAVRKEVNGNKIIWTPQGTVEQYEPDGTLKIWYAKPTLGLAIQSSGKLNFPTAYQFNRDGSVFMRLRGIPFWWPAKEAEPVVGPYDLAYGYSEHAGWLFIDTPCDCSECDAEDYGDRYD